MIISCLFFAPLSDFSREKSNKVFFLSLSSARSPRFDLFFFFFRSRLPTNSTFFVLLFVFSSVRSSLFFFQKRKREARGGERERWK